MSKHFGSVGRPLPAPPGQVRHEYEAFGTGDPVVVVRDARGRFLPRNQMSAVRDPWKLGRPVVDPTSALKRSLGLPVNTWRKK